MYNIAQSSPQEHAFGSYNNRNAYIQKPNNPFISNYNPLQPSQHQQQQYANPLVQQQVQNSSSIPNGGQLNFVPQSPTVEVEDEENNDENVDPTTIVQIQQPVKQQKRKNTITVEHQTNQKTSKKRGGGGGTTAATTTTVAINNTSATKQPRGATKTIVKKSKVEQKQKSSSELSTGESNRSKPESGCYRPHKQIPAISAEFGRFHRNIAMYFKYNRQEYEDFLMTADINYPHDITDVVSKVIASMIKRTKQRNQFVSSIRKIAGSYSTEVLDREHYAKLNEVIRGSAQEAYNRYNKSLSRNKPDTDDSGSNS